MWGLKVAYVGAKSCVWVLHVWTAAGAGWAVVAKCLDRVRIGVWLLTKKLNTSGLKAPVKN